VGRPPATPTAPLAVVGAHRTGQPLHRELVELGALVTSVIRTAPHYRLFALTDPAAPRAGLVRVATGGAGIEVEVHQLPLAAYGALLLRLPPPLGIGTLDLIDGRRVLGCLCESYAITHATDITRFGSWPEYLSHTRHIPAGTPPDAAQDLHTGPQSR
jgi:allophanate hydrolase